MTGDVDNNGKIGCDGADENLDDNDYVEVSDVDSHRNEDVGGDGHGAYEDKISLVPTIWLERKNTQRIQRRKRKRKTRFNSRKGLLVICANIFSMCVNRLISRIMVTTLTLFSTLERRKATSTVTWRVRR